MRRAVHTEGNLRRTDAQSTSRTKSIEPVARVNARHLRVNARHLRVDARHLRVNARHLCARRRSARARP